MKFAVAHETSCRTFRIKTTATRSTGSVVEKTTTERRRSTSVPRRLSFGSVADAFYGNFMSNSTYDGDHRSWKGTVCQIKIKLTNDAIFQRPEKYERNQEDSESDHEDNPVVPVQSTNEVVFPETINKIFDKPFSSFMGTPASSGDHSQLAPGTTQFKLPTHQFKSPEKLTSLKFKMPALTFGSPSKKTDTVYKCRKCSKKFTTQISRDKHSKICKRTHKECNQCHARFWSEKLLYDHVQKHHKSPNYQCAKCGVNLMTDRLLVEHYATVHGENISVETATDKPEEHVDGTNTWSEQRMNDEQKWPCSICNQVLKSKANLQQHFKRHTDTDKIFGCEQCGAKFTQELYLKSHERRVHCPAEPCRHCGVLIKRDSMRRHLLRVHGSKSSSNRCSVCYDEFENSDQLYEHRKTHKIAHMCELCGKTFDTQSLLRDHKEWHSEEPKYPCDLCDKKFYIQKALRKHKNSVHAPTRDFKCEVCGKAFKTFTVFKNHRDIHDNERRHKCKICGKGFNSSGSLVNHRRVHEREWMLDV